MATNRLIGTADRSLYRVREGEPMTKSARPIYDALIDMSWVPPLEPGVYWIEFASAGVKSIAPTAVYPRGDENAIRYDALLERWSPAIDGGSGVALDFPFTLFQEAGCFPDCDGDGALTFFDFLCFQSEFGAGRSGADCDGDDELTFFDFLCFQTAFASGCP